ncbi:hypothetical protein AAG570_013848 [Ranatra chinensis]|uniref:C2H2-type domain-containing protein n=1 Tax=Ranatra chinensis TaxID=642074 RepID=A0ABD0YFB0_9HEMI
MTEFVWLVAGESDMRVRLAELLQNLSHRSIAGCKYPWDAASQRYKCDRCNRSYRYYTGLYRHRKECDGSDKTKIHTCPYCPFLTSNSDKMAQHCARQHTAPALSTAQSNAATP